MDEINPSAGDGVGAAYDHDREQQEPGTHGPAETTPTAPGDVGDDDWLPV